MIFKLNIKLFASKKGVGSTKNGRDSAGRRLGAKVADGQWCHAGSIIYRQRGTRIYPGENTKRGKDDTTSGRWPSSFRQPSSGWSSRRPAP